jgi:hypothetical protein
MRFFSDNEFVQLTGRVSASFLFLKRDVILNEQIRIVTEIYICQ